MITGRRTTSANATRWALWSRDTRAGRDEPAPIAPSLGDDETCDSTDRIDGVDAMASGFGQAAAAISGA